MAQARNRAKPPRLVTRAVDFKSTQDHGDGRTLEGYAAVFDSPTEIDSWEGTFTEVLARGAFKRTLNARTPVLQFDHGHDARTGSVPIGAFTDLSEDEVGLRVQARLFDNPVVEPIRQAIEGGAISGMSFRFRVVRDQWTNADGKKLDGEDLLDALWSSTDPAELTRTIKEVELFEAGPVVFPAYEATSVGVRNMLEKIDGMTSSERRQLIAALSGDVTPERDDVVEDDPVRALLDERALNLSDAQESLLQSLLNDLAVGDAAVDPIVDALVAADEALDEALMVLAEILGVDNPDPDPDLAADEADEGGSADD